MLGNVFSPYYSFARRKTPADPLNHCAMNVALYGPRGKHWAMTERPRDDVLRTPTLLKIGPSSVSWDGECLAFRIEEVTVPFLSRIQGEVRVFPPALGQIATQLHPSGLHQWMPLAPMARVEVNFKYPDKTWTGNGYLDCNFGREPLENAFKRWDWSRGRTPNGTVIFYNVETRDGDRVSISRLYDRSVEFQHFPSQTDTKLKSTLWRIERRTSCGLDREPRILKTLEDTPFYARSLLEMTVEGEPTSMVHESLSLDRFANPIVRAMLPFRMPRRRYSR